MKELIRHILREETEVQKVKKGIDMLIKIVNKTYPFIVGWDFDEHPYPLNLSKYYLYLNVLVDHKLVQEYYDRPFKSFYRNYPEEIQNAIEKKQKYAYAGSLLEDDRTLEEKHSENKIIEKYFEEVYEYIPDEYKLYYESTDFFGKDSLVEKEINIDGYIFV
jgi:hypothetical protein